MASLDLALANCSVSLAGRSRSSHREPGNREQDWRSEQRPQSTGQMHHDEIDVLIGRVFSIVLTRSQRRARGQDSQNHKHPDYAECDHASQTPFAKRHDLCMLLGCQLTPKLSCKRPTQYAAHLHGCTSNPIGGNRNDFLRSRACQLQRHVRRLVRAVRRRSLCQVRSEVADQPS
jgi:hypothetical protein